MNFYKDGSKSREVVGFGEHARKLKLNLSRKFLDNCSGFKAEKLAIKEAVDWLRLSSASATAMYNDTYSRDAVMALDFPP